MKKISVYLSAITLTILMVSCNATKNTTSRTDEKTTSMDKEQKEEVNVTETAKESIESEDKDDNAKMNNGTIANSDETMASKTATAFSSDSDYSQMYTTLGMNEDQIQSFENALDDFKQRQRSTPSGEMLGTVEAEEGRQLKQILTSNQYDSYERWKSEN